MVRLFLLRMRRERPRIGSVIKFVVLHRIMNSLRADYSWQSSRLTSSLLSNPILSFFSSMTVRHPILFRNRTLYSGSMYTPSEVVVIKWKSQYRPSTREGRSRPSFSLRQKRRLKDVFNHLFCPREDCIRRQNFSEQEKNLFTWLVFPMSDTLSFCVE